MATACKDGQCLQGSHGFHILCFHSLPYGPYASLLASVASDTHILLKYSHQRADLQVLGWVERAFQWMQQTPAFASLEAAPKGTGELCGSGSLRVADENDMHASLHVITIFQGTAYHS